MTESFIEEAASVLERTPATLDALLRGLPESWIRFTDAPGEWSAFDVLGHLIHGERTDWIPRIEIILEHGTGRPFDRFDREAQFRDSGSRTTGELLDEFSRLRADNLAALRRYAGGSVQLGLEGTHPELGRVTLRQLLATWTAHDLSHLTQISRTMARRYRDEVGPWAQYLSVMRR